MYIRLGNSFVLHEVTGKLFLSPHPHVMLKCLSVLQGHLSGNGGVKQGVKHHNRKKILS